MHNLHSVGVAGKNNSYIRKSVGGHRWGSIRFAHFDYFDGDSLLIR
jgi:hypothetical protein